MFKIEITDTETNKVTRYEADCICAGLHLLGDEDGEGTSVGMFHGNPIKHYATAMAAQEAASELFKQNPLADFIRKSLNEKKAHEEMEDFFKAVVKTMGKFSK